MRLRTQLLDAVLTALDNNLLLYIAALVALLKL